MSIRELVGVANKLDSLGMEKEADELDLIIQKIATRNLSGFLKFLDGAEKGEASSIPYEVKLLGERRLIISNTEPNSELDVGLANRRGSVREVLFNKVDLPPGTHTFDLSERSQFATYGLFDLSIWITTQNGNNLAEFISLPPVGGAGFEIKVGR